MIILTDAGSSPSAKILRDALQRHTTEKILVSKRPDKLKKGPAIRYGCSDRIFEGDTSLNSAEFIQLVSNKKRFADLLIENDIYAPKFEKTGLGKATFPFVVRETLSSSGGEGIHFIGNEEQLRTIENKGYWWTSYVPCTYECRVHVLGGEVVKIFRKEWNKGDEPLFPIRNSQNGYHFSVRNIEKNPMICELVDKIHTLLPSGAEFYALDLGYIREEKRYFVFEANSAPGLNEQSADLYATHIAMRLRLI